MRDLKELHWRSRGPRLPQTVLDAATLRIGAPLPETYRVFLSQVDGGRIGRGGFRANEQEWQIGGFFPFADAAGLAEKLRKSGKLPQGFMPVAYADSPEKPLVYMELSGAGRVFLKPSAKSKWEDQGAVQRLGDSFAEFLDLLGDAPKDLTNVNQPELGGQKKAPAPAPRPAPASKPITSPAAAAARAISAAASLKARPAANGAAPRPVAPARKAAPAKVAAAPAAKAKPAKAAAPAKAPAKSKTKAAPKASPAKAGKKPAAKAAKKPAAKAAKKPAAKKPAARAARPKKASGKAGAPGRRR
ncbi:MAG: hypothetical protein M9894_05260 [Planctomycetes bacterium]|nr:hypothetical protein [Planctomycetota bacterium]